MERALAEMDRRRAIQVTYNAEHGITPRSIVKSLEKVRLSTYVADARSEKVAAIEAGSLVGEDLHDPAVRAKAIAALKQQMKEAAANLEFELAALLRDQVNDLKASGAPNVRRDGGRRKRFA
jgi:excinuclease ABC subunit B